MSQYGLSDETVLQNKHKKCINSSEKQFVKHTERYRRRSFHPLWRKCKTRKSKEIFSKPDVDGLIGGAALKSDDFVAIVNAFKLICNIGKAAIDLPLFILLYIQ
jgi:hypothetical protein